MVEGEEKDLGEKGGSKQETSVKRKEKKQKEVKGRSSQSRKEAPGGERER